jgi:glycerol-3-phosphate acyltransferase PlsY
LGSIPSGFLVGKARGIDIRKLGSGNIGATNVFRNLGKPAGSFVLFADALKGWVAAFVLSRLVANRFAFPSEDFEWLAVVAGVCAILGHNYTCWLHFKGGKGVATSAGVLIALVPWSLVIILSIFLLVFAISKYVSLGSIAAAISLPIAAWATKESLTMILIMCGLSALAIFKHRANIVRLMNGTEHRVGQKTPPTPAQQKSS